MIKAIRDAALALAICALAACGSSASAGYGPFYTTSAASTISIAGPYAGGSLCERTTGIGPLGVMFSAVGTTSTLQTSPSTVIAGYHFIYYSWSFGDPSSGTWSFGAPTAAGGTSGGTGNSRNAAYGPVAAHVFDPTPGGGDKTYTVTLTAFDGTNTVSQTACTVTVYDPWGAHGFTTITCVGATTLPVAGVDGCPAGAAAAQQSSMATISSTYLGSNKLVLLKHDDTFTGNLDVSCSTCEVNMYGTGAKPILSGAVVNIHPPTVDTIVDDMRVVNVVATGGGGGAAVLNVYDGCTPCSGHTGGVTHDLVYKSTIENDTTAVNGVEHDNFADVTPSGMMLVDNTFQSIGSSGEIMFIDAANAAIMGNNVIGNGSSSQHVLRVQWSDTMTVNNNTLSNFPSSKENIGIRGVNQPNSTAQPWLGTYPVTQYDVVSDNNIISNAGAYGINLAPNDQTSSNVEIIQNVIVERNYLHTTTGSGQTNCGRAEGQYITFRDEICDLSQSSYGYPNMWFADYASAGAEPSGYIWIYNNTGYTNAALAAPNSIQGIQVNSGVGSNGWGNVYASNNLFYFPSWGGTQNVIYGSGAYTESNNTCGTGATHSCAGTLTTNPSFVNGSGTLGIPSDFKIGNVTYEGTGTSVPVWYDALGVSWGGSYDLGAVKH